MICVLFSVWAPLKQLELPVPRSVRYFISSCILEPTPVALYVLIAVLRRCFENVTSGECFTNDSELATQ